MNEQKPTVGRIVHYVDEFFGNKCLAAIITQVDPDGAVSLSIWNPTGGSQYAETAPDHSEPNDTDITVRDWSALNHKWHWPERS